MDILFPSSDLQENLCSLQGWHCYKLDANHDAQPTVSKTQKYGKPKSYQNAKKLAHFLTISQKIRVRTDSKKLFSSTFQDLQRPNSKVFQDSQNSFSRTFKDKFGSQTWLHKVQKVHISN